MVDNLFRALRYRNFRLFFTGQGISLVGTQIQAVAMSWLAYRLTGSAAMLGLVNFVSRAPIFICAPFAGVLVDRVDRHKAMILIQTLEMLQAVALAVLAIWGHLQVWHLFVPGGSLGIMGGFEVPIRQAFIYEAIDDKKHLSNALALNTTIIQLSSLLGPVLAGFLVAAIGEGWCFTINAISFIAVLVCLLGVRTVPVERKTAATGNKAFQEGFQHAFGTLPLRYLLLLLALVSFAGLPYQVLLPVFAKVVLKGGPSTLGFLGSAVGLGALGGTLYLASRQTIQGLEKRIAFAASILGTGLILFGLSRSLPLSLLVLIPVGLGSAMQITGCMTLIQTLVEDRFRGRVMSFYTMAFMGTIPFGGLLFGYSADHIGAPTTVLIGGAVCLAAGGFFFVRVPHFNHHAKPILERKGLPSLQ